MRRTFLTLLTMFTVGLCGATGSRCADPAKPAAQPQAKKPTGPLPTDAAQESAPKLPPKDGKRETLYLFNGKDLAGWVGHKDKYWSVQGDEIVGRNTDEVPVSTYLLTERKFSDFRLTFDFKLAESEMHSGIAMWGRIAPERGDAYTYAGHLVMFPSGYGFYDLYGRNAIHRNGDKARPLNKQHDWNHIEILAQGNRIRFVLNGTLVSDWREPEPDRIKEAALGLQLHSNKVPQEVRFKNLVLETFPEDKLTTVTAAKSISPEGYTGTTTINGGVTIGGGTTITKVSSGGTLVLSGTNTYTSGGVTIHGGTLTINAVAKAEDNDDGRAIPLAVVPPCCAGLGDVKKFRVYFGTYTKTGKSEGIYRAELDIATGKLSEPVLAVATPSPSFLVVHPNRKFVYAVGEAGGVAKGAKPNVGAVSAFAVDEATGDLKRLNEQSSGGNGPCHITIDTAGKNVLIANYGAGSCGVLPIKDDGSLAEMSCYVVHSGEVADPKRQGGPRGHSINLDPANKFAFCADLGLDKVLIYKYDAAAGQITANDPAFAATARRAGPRHFAFHPSGKFAYVINEIDCTITAFSYDAAKGTLTTVQTVPTLPPGVDVVPKFSTAEVQVHPSGKFVYGSNRTQDSIVAFSVDETTGKLTLVGHQGEGVKTPRNFGIDPTGKYAVVCNQAGDDVLVFAIDPQTGALTKTLSRIEVGAPVCVKFVPIPEKK
ncbi:MAG: beta-propeller fold lactonase family protein [Pirellulales bacterium]